VNTILSALLFLWIGFAGIALATVIASWLNIIMLWHRLQRRGDLVVDARLRRNGPRIALASLVMGAALLAGQHVLATLLAGSFLVKASALAALVIGGVAVFGALALLLRAVTFADVRKTLGRG
jgi:putative peptidoglycan lipid II flippase